MSQAAGQGEAMLPKNGSVMADVAMSPMITAPTKFLFPRAAAAASASPFPAFEYSLLGLGDVLVPGLLVGLLLRYDSAGPEGGARKEGKGSLQPASDPAQLSTPFFKSSLAAYSLGLVASFAASILSGKGQPALLYLVPFTVGSATVLGLRKKQLGQLWNFTTKTDQAT